MWAGSNGRGNPKTLTPSPRTPTTDRVHGLPMDWSTDYPYGPPLRTTPQNRIKIINKYFSYGLPNRLLVTVKFRTLRCANVTDLNSGSSPIYIITHCHFLCCGRQVYERRVRGSLRETSKFVLFPLCHFVQPILPWGRELVPGFTICSAE